MEHVVAPESVSNADTSSGLFEKAWNIQQALFAPFFSELFLCVFTKAIFGILEDSFHLLLLGEHL